MRMADSCSEGKPLSSPPTLVGHSPRQPQPHPMPTEQAQPVSSTSTDRLSEQQTESQDVPCRIVAVLTVAITVAAILLINVMVVLLISDDRGTTVPNNSSTSPNETGSRGNNPSATPFVPNPTFAPTPRRIPSTPFPTTPFPSPAPTRPTADIEAVTQFIASITLRNQNNVYSIDDDAVTPSPSSSFGAYDGSDDDQYDLFLGRDDVLHWLLEKDPLQLVPNNAGDRFRLQQRYALLTLGMKPRLTDADWQNTTVLDMIWDECKWPGVTCNPVEVDNMSMNFQNVVTSLNISVYGNVQDFLPPDIGLLSYLTWLHLPNPHTVTTLPVTLGRLTNLVYFNCSAAAFGQLALPESVVNWTRIHTVALRGSPEYSDDSWRVGPLPNGIGAWTNLHDLELTNCGLNGSLPSLSFCSHVQRVVLSDNAFSGALPSFDMSRLSLLEELNVARNKLHSTLPIAMSTWNNLRSVNFAENELTGSIPDWIGQWTNLQHIDLSYTKLNATLPHSMGNWTNVSTVILSGNNFTGQLPESLGQWTGIERFSIQFNQLNGTIPNAIGNWNASIQHVDMWRNDFVGTMPTSLCSGAAPNLTWLSAGCLVQCDCCTYCV